MKNIIKLSVSILLTVSLLVTTSYCLFNITTQGKTVYANEKELKFESDFESTDFSGWTKEAANDKSIQIAPFLTRSGMSVAKVTIAPGDVINNGHRAELSCKDRAPIGKEIVYKFSFMIPILYKETDMWQYISQFHDRPDVAHGETWATYNSHYPPPLSLSYHKNIITVKRYDKKDGYHIIASTNIKKGNWVDITYRIKWSEKNDGFIEVFVNGKNVSNGKVYGPNLYNSSGNYFKIGIYEDKKNPYKNSLYYDDVSIDY